jgi:hypothetical protein
VCKTTSLRLLAVHLQLHVSWCGLCQAVIVRSLSRSMTGTHIDQRCVCTACTLSAENSGTASVSVRRVSVQVGVHCCSWCTGYAWVCMAPGMYCAFSSATRM